ncbi:hypothetical protein [Mycetohabitans sp. B46]|uniref:hypothetical protein n=1 Tax=Mycetohabitans sp. B46 TaxID=2772536 RepID=UPI00307F7734
MSASAEHRTGEAPITAPRVVASPRYEREEHDGIDERDRSDGPELNGDAMLVRAMPAVSGDGNLHKLSHTDTTSASAEYRTGEAPITAPRVVASPRYEREEHDGIDERDRSDGPELNGDAMLVRAMPAVSGDANLRKLSHTDTTKLQGRDDTEVLHDWTDAAHLKTGLPATPVKRPSEEYKRRSLSRASSLSVFHGPRPDNTRGNSYPDISTIFHAVPSIDVPGHAHRRARASLPISPTKRSSSEQDAGVLNVLPHFFHDTNFNPLEAFCSTQGDTVATLEERPAAPLSARLRTWMREAHADFADCRTMPCPHRGSPQPWTTLFDVDARMRQYKEQADVREALERRVSAKQAVPVTPDAFDQLNQRDKLWVALRVIDAEGANDDDRLAWSVAAILFPCEVLRERQHRMVVQWMLRMFDLRLDLVALGERGARPGELDAFVRAAAARDIDRQDRLEQLERALHALAVYEIVPRMRSILEPTSAQLHEVAKTTFRVVEALERLAAEVVPTAVQQGAVDTDYADRFNQLFSGTI